MRDILSTAEVDVLYSHNDAMTLGAVESIEAGGMIPGKDIVIITVDGEQGAIDLLKQGKINCVVECTPMLGDIIMGNHSVLVDALRAWLESICIWI